MRFDGIRVGEVVARLTARSLYSVRYLGAEHPTEDVPAMDGAVWGLNTLVKVAQYHGDAQTPVVLGAGSVKKLKK